jgi:hypothetical protein
MDWIQTRTGKKFYPFAPRPEDIDIEDIAHALSMLCRYAGHTSQFYSVAEHSVHVAEALVLAGQPKHVVAAGLMHDATEAYLVDLPRPVKNGLPGYKDAEVRLAAVIAEKFGLPPVAPPIVKEFDTRILRNEAEALLGPGVDGWWESLERLEGVTIYEAMPPVWAKFQFMNWFRRVVA